MGANAIDNLQAFLYQTARNVVIDFYRRRGSLKDEPIFRDEAREEQLKIDIADPKQDPLKKIQLSSDIEEVKKALQKIREEYREVIILRFIEELSVKETAAVLGKTEGAVRVLLHRAVASLREIMKVRTK